MKTLCLLAMLLIAPNAWANTITFTPGEDTMNWTFEGYTTPLIQEGMWQTSYGNTSAFPSADYALYNGFGVNFISFYGPLATVEGFWIAPWTAGDQWFDPYSAHMVTLDGWGAEGYHEHLTMELTPGFQYVSTGFTQPVNDLWFRTWTTERKWFLLDDVTLSVTPEATDQFLARIAAENAPNLPEPATWILLLAGLTLMLAASKIVTHT